MGQIDTAGIKPAYGPFKKSNLGSTSLRACLVIRPRVVFCLTENRERMFLGHLNYPATMVRNAPDGLNYCWIRIRTVIFLSQVDLSERANIDTNRVIPVSESNGGLSLKAILQKGFEPSMTCLKGK